MLDLDKLTEEQKEGFFEIQKDIIRQVVFEFSKALPEDSRKKLTYSISELYEEYRKAGLLIEDEAPKFDVNVNNTDDELVYNIEFIPKNKAAVQVMKAYNSVQE